MLPAVLENDSSPESPESGAWDGVRTGWRQCYGSFAQLGVSIETHDFRSTRELDWARSFHPGSVEICLNLTGRGRVAHGVEQVEVGADSAACYVAGAGALTAERNAREAHRFVTLELSRDFLRQQLVGCEDGVEPGLRRALLGPRPRSALATPRRLGSSGRGLADSLWKPPVAPAALPLWYQSKVTEAVAQFLFSPTPELFCTRQRRLAQERVERVTTILHARLTEPPTLEELGRAVGVSQFYLSRIFSEEMRMTIPQYLRRIRMERAAELLRAGRHNVTEAAFAVGYSSLGHFSKSFCEVIGCCPALYPLPTPR